ncbi:hypothetical protein FOCC_FOCC007120 [Frankliniella occidentalis]|nr:hypothetical protein FOCC_FOCC007120 [Frankliniella occidentalis]
MKGGPEPSRHHQELRRGHQEHFQQSPGAVSEAAGAARVPKKDVEGLDWELKKLAKAVLNVPLLAKLLPGLRWCYSERKETFELHVPADGRVTIVDSESRGHLIRVLRQAAQSAYRANLQKKPDQGKVFRVVAASPASNHFLTHGRNTRFADWRFIHRARLGGLPLRGCLRGPAATASSLCWRCGQHAETTAHVLCHCPPALAEGITRRHNAIQESLLQSLASRGRLQGVTVKVDKPVPFSELMPPDLAVAVPDSLRRLRPDALLINHHGKQVVILDVTCPFENGWAALYQARAAKVSKYGPIAEHLEKAGWIVALDAFVVGSLGAWGPANGPVLKYLGLSRANIRNLTHCTVSTAVHHLKEIYLRHVIPSSTPSCAA